MDELIARAIAAPLGAASIEPPGTNSSTLCVLFPDPTRDPVLSSLLECLLNHVEKLGWHPAQVTLVMATGMHSPPRRGTPLPFAGSSDNGGYRVLIHDSGDRTNLVRLGTTGRGTPVTLHRCVVDSDRVVVLSAASFHYFAGFGGGRKLLMPGVAADESILANHRLSLRGDGSWTLDPACRPGGLMGNPVHEDMREAAALIAGYISFTAVIHPTAGIERIYCGEPDLVMKAAAKELEERYAFEIERPYDFVIVSAGGHPWDVNLVQSHKALRNIFRAVRPGGAILALFACGQGIGSTAFGENFDRLSREDGREVPYSANLQTAVSLKEIVSNLNVALYSQLETETVVSFGFEPVEDPQRFLSRKASCGEIGRCLVVPRGASTLIRGMH